MLRSAWLIIPLLIALAAGLLVFGVSRAPEAAQATPDDQGPRIVALSPAIAVILTDLGEQDRIVGRAGSDTHLPGSIPVAGDYNGIDYERLLRLRPTHILLERNAQDPPDRLLSLAKEHNWKIRTYPMLALDDIPVSVNRLAVEFADPQGRAWASRWKSEFDALFAERSESIRNAGTVLPLYWSSPPGIAGPGSFHAEILERLGFDLAITEGGPYIVADPEDLLRLQPDSILLLIPGGDPNRINELLGPLADLDLRAIREGRVALVRNEMTHLPATSILDLVREILDATAPWETQATATAE